MTNQKSQNENQRNSGQKEQARTGAQANQQQRQPTNQNKGGNASGANDKSSPNKESNQGKR